MHGRVETVCEERRPSDEATTTTLEPQKESEVMAPSRGWSISISIAKTLSYTTTEPSWHPTAVRAESGDAPMGHSLNQ